MSLQNKDLGENGLREFKAQWVREQKAELALAIQKAA